MKKTIILFFLALTGIHIGLAAQRTSLQSDTSPRLSDAPPTRTEAAPTRPHTLVAYFSWGGNTQHVAEYIAAHTGAALFRIEPRRPYPAAYKPCTEVAKAEKEQNARPALRRGVENFAAYDTVFVGCPVWWWTAPMIIHTFVESHDFAGKTVIPFCTYAATYRDETLACIVGLTPTARHLKGFGAVGRSTDGIDAWLREIGMYHPQTPSR